MNAFIAGTTLWSLFFAATTGPVLAGLLIVLKMNNVQIGIINSLTLVTLSSQVLGAWLQPRLSRKRKGFWFITGAVYYASYILLIALLHCWGMLNHRLAVWLFIAVFGGGLVFVNLGVPVWFSWAGDLVPPRESNRFWNRRGGFSQLSLVISSLAVGVIIDYLGRKHLETYIWVIGAGTVFGIISMFFSLSAGEPEPLRKVRPVSTFSKVRLIWRNVRFRQLVYFFGLQAFAQWLIIPFTFIYLQRTLNLSMSVIQLLVALSSVTSFFATYVFQVLGSRYGRKPIVLLCTFIKGMEFISWALLLPGSPWFVTIIPFIIGGFVNIGLLTSTFSLITSSGRQQLKTLSIALFFALTGLLGFAASGLSGLIYDWLETLPFIETSLLTPYNLIAAAGSGLLFASMLLFLKFREEGAAPTVKVVKTLFANNPFRAIYNTHVLSNPLEEKARILTLGKAEGNLMMAELVNDLYSPSSRIRESAVWNIGRKGKKADPVFADELLKVLDMPALGIQSQAARALGHLQCRKATKYLVKYLDRRDTGLTQSCIFALGLIGDKAAVSELENILRRDRFRMLWPQAAEALGRIGDFRHTRDIHHAYAVEFNWVLKKQFLIALLKTVAPDKNKIYSLFEQAEKTTGTGTEKIIRTIRAAVVKKDKTADLKDQFVRVIHHDDHNNYLAALEQLMVIIFNGPESMLPGRDWTAGNLAGRLNPLFAADRQLRTKELLQNNLKSVLFWLLIELWAELKYAPGAFDRYLYLTALQTAEFIVRGDDE
ncbi:MAG: HEAT repeat domain-containing protein [Victivallaceae bacterium]|nr:HEAT repeat domain-containing protein [Victivallaceae bacterium]